MASPIQAPTQQYLRDCTLIVSGKNVPALDLSPLRIKFSVKRSQSATPNTADIRIYNLSDDTAIAIRQSYKQVVLNAGYQCNNGVIFRGNIKQAIIGRESGTDTFIDLLAGDGALAYNQSIVRTTLAAGCSQADQVSTLVNWSDPANGHGGLAFNGVSQGPTAPLSTAKLPRGKVMYGDCKDYLRTVSQTTGVTWSIQDEQITFVPSNSYLPGTAVVLNSQTGMIGTPQQTNSGINVKCLLNPNLKINRRVQLDNKTIELFRINFQIPGSATNIPYPLSSNGVYYIFIAEHTGDNRGVEWYTTLSLLNISVSTNPLNAVPLGTSGLPQ